jgi:signal transduction histidine kinase
VQAWDTRGRRCTVLKIPSTEAEATTARLPHLLAYVAALEVEIDRLRRDNRLVHEAMHTALLRLRDQFPGRNADPQAAPVDLDAAVQETLTTLNELRDLPGYHPAFDQVVAVAVRPLIEQIFRRHHRLLNMPAVTLRLALESEHIEWFPARLRIILDNLLCNSLKYRDDAKDASWVEVGLRSGANGYEFCIRDNGMGLSASQQSRALSMQQRTATGRIAGTGVGLAVVKALVEQSGGELRIDAGEGQGTAVRVVLPRYEIDDFLI